MGRTGDTWDARGSHGTDGGHIRQTGDTMMDTWGVDRRAGGVVRRDGKSRGSLGEPRGRSMGRSSLWNASTACGRLTPARAGASVCGSHGGGSIIEVAMWQEVWKVLEKPRDIRHGHRHISNTFHMRDRGVSLGRRSTVGVWVSGSGMNEHLFRVRCVRPPDLRHPGRGSRSILSVKLHRLRG
jgi:hypothetical protein